MAAGIPNGGKLKMDHKSVGLGHNIRLAIDTDGPAIGESGGG